MSVNPELLKIREEIDAIDQQIQKLINARADCAMRVAEVKQAEMATSGEAPVYYRPERETQILARVMERNEGPLPKEEVARIFREIMSGCLALERPLAVGYLGPIGTFTEVAALKHFGHAVDTRPLTTISEVFRDVDAGNLDYGVVPIENSTEGMVTHTLECFLDSPLVICGEVEMRIHQALMVKPGTDVSAVKTIFSHQQSLAQCRLWLDANCPDAERQTVSSNAEAARLVSESDPNDGYAAVAGERAAETYGLTLVAGSIEDRPDNTTRFLVIGKQTTEPSGRDKTSLIVSVKNEPGALYRLLEPFERHGIDMTRLESRPSHSGIWSYRFFIDFKGHVDDAPIQKFLDDIRAQSAELKILGSYPRAVL
ncbi:MAG: prephenate dehydratase [Gammaproteobacteria bacterium]|nr:prephenate dehydratase [Gammaproteobacteria bacterium]